jgi:uncharacterized membrane-anchored protein
MSLIRPTGNPNLDAIVEFEIRYNQTRWAEVWLAVKMLLVGVVFLHEPGSTFSTSHGFDFLARFVSEPVAGVIAFSAGTIRLAALWVNGAQRRSPIIRMIGCSLGTLFWGALLFGFILAGMSGDLVAWPLVYAFATANLFAEIHSSARSARDAAAYGEFKTAGSKNASISSFGGNP